MSSKTVAVRLTNGWVPLAWPRNSDELVLARQAIDTETAYGLYIGKHPDGAYVPKSMDGIMDFCDIESIRFGDVGNLSIKGLEKFQKLKSLWMEEVEPFDISALKDLQKLSFTASRNFDVSFRLPRLKSLTVSKSAVKDCNFLINFKMLEDIVLLQARKLKSAEGIESAKKITNVVLGYSPRLTDLSSLRNCISLKSLELRHLKSIEDIESIFGISNLERLNIEKCNAIPTLQAIGKLKLLKHFALIDTDVVDGNLLPLLNVNGLRHVGIYPNRKHFVPKASDVELSVKSRTD